MIDRGVNTNSNHKRIFDRIFKNLDKTKDGVLPKDETSDFGLSSSKSKPLNREGFAKAFDSFFRKTGSIESMLDGFGDIFYKGSDLELMHDVELSKEQQKELLSRMEMFDAYYSSLPKEQQEELLKIKSDMMCFNWFRKDAPIPEDYKLPDDKDKTTTKSLKDLPDYQYVQIREFMEHEYKDLKAKLKDGKQTTVSNAMLAKYLKFASVNELESDGKIGGFRQGSVGDCWFLSSLINYTSSPEGEKNINDRIKNNGDGTYSVTFNNPFEQTKKEIFTVSKEELANYKKISRNNNEKEKAFSSGDIDVRIMEIAANKMFEKYIPKEELENKDDLPIEGSSYLKEAILHKALGYKDNIEYYYTIDNKNSEWNGKIQKTTGNVTLRPDGKAELSDMEYYNYDTSSFIDLAQSYGFKACELTCGSVEKENHELAKKEENKAFIKSKHGYNIAKISEDGIVTNNPSYASFPHVLKRDLFNNSFFNIMAYFPQKNLITVDECTN